jgi:hypothetical protein
MHLDIRLPMGLFFLATGLILVGYGLTADPAIYARHSLGQNVNLQWGVVFASFGAAMLWLTVRARAAAAPDSAATTPGKP